MAKSGRDVKQRLFKIEKRNTDTHTQTCTHKQNKLQNRCNALAWNPMEAFNFTVANEDCCLYTYDMRKLTGATCVHKVCVCVCVCVCAVMSMRTTCASSPAPPACTRCVFVCVCVCLCVCSYEYAFNMRKLTGTTCVHKVCVYGCVCMCVTRTVQKLASTYVCTVYVYACHTP